MGQQSQVIGVAAGRVRRVGHGSDIGTSSGHLSAERIEAVACRSAHRASLAPIVSLEISRPATRI